MNKSLRNILIVTLLLVIVALVLGGWNWAIGVFVASYLFWGGVAFLTAKIVSHKPTLEALKVALLWPFNR